MNSAAETRYLSMQKVCINLYESKSFESAARPETQKDCLTSEFQHGAVCHLVFCCLRRVRLSAVFSESLSQIWSFLCMRSSTPVEARRRIPRLMYRIGPRPPVSGSSAPGVLETVKMAFNSFCAGVNTTVAPCADSCTDHVDGFPLPF